MGALTSTTPRPTATHVHVYINCAEGSYIHSCRSVGPDEAPCQIGACIQTNPSDSALYLM